MSIKTKILQIKNTPPKVVLKKILTKFQNELKNNKQRQTDSKYSTFKSTFKNAINIANFFQLSIDSFSEKTKSTILEYGDLIIDHKFNFFGSGWISWDRDYDVIDLPKSSIIDSNKITEKNDSRYKPLNWQKDFKNNYQWNTSVWYRDISYKDSKADIKAPWELGRLQHLPSLAYCYKISNNEKYVDEFKNQTLDFIGNNPPRFGVQWKTSMDVAFRSVNLLVAYDLFIQNNIKFDEEFNLIFTNSIFQHGEHISNNLEWAGGQRGNHYLANIVGLLFISYYLGNNADPNWLKFSIFEFFQELEYQFNDDGSNFEGSTSYHFLSLEMILHGLNLIFHIDFDILKSIPKIERFVTFDKSLILKPKLIDKFINIYKFTNSILTDDKELFVIGDSDNGYFLKFPIKNVESIEGLKFSFNRKDLLFNLRHFIEKKLKIDLTDIKYDSEISNFFNDFGLYVYNYYDFKLMIRCGSLGQNGKGGHTHCDQLSIYLAYKNTPIIIDSGNLLYTSDIQQRNLYRSSSQHNTLVIDGMEQEIINNDFDSLFWLGNKSKAVVIEASESKFIGQHFGYGEPHIREINLYDNEISILDKCKIRKNRIQIIIPKFSEFELKNHIVRIKLNESTIIFDSIVEDWQIEEITIAKSYGEESSAWKLYIESDNFEINWKIRFLK